MNADASQGGSQATAPDRAQPSPRPTAGTVPAAFDARAGWALLVLFCAAFFVFCSLYVPRLNNNVMSDREFTGWSGPIAERLVAGERLYVDVVLPIPPGSFLVLAAIQNLAGKALLLQELWSGAVIQLVLALLAVAMARRFLPWPSAVLVGLCTLVALLQLPKECLYDHTAQLCAWSSLAVGLLALGATEQKRARALWFATGLLAVATTGFKQSTATGIVLGWALAATYLIARAWRSRGREAARSTLRELVPALAGGALGLVFAATLVLAAGGTVSAYMQAVFFDAPELKGGLDRIATTLTTYVLRRHSFTGSILVTLVAIAVGFRVVGRRGTLDVTRSGDDPPRQVEAVYVAAAIVCAFGVGFALLASEVRELPRWLWAFMTRLADLPGIGLAFAAAFFVAHGIRARPPDSDVADATRDPRVVFNAFAIVSVTCSLMHDASFDRFEIFYNNNPLIACSFIALFSASRQAGVPGLTAVVVALSIAPIAGRKLNRALSADVPVTEGHWAGMRVNYRGVEILKAARRVREITTENDTVLVLPEDVQLVGLIDRPRPPLRGAIVFVDQYAKRLVEHDLVVLDSEPPRVIIIHPREERDWRRLFATWSEDSAAADVLEHVQKELLPEYDLDSSYPTVHFWDQGHLDVYVRKSGR